jgi:magnesium-transporting ATPase (P-type)
LKCLYILFQGQSPDEISLVDAAKNAGFVYLGANNQQVIELEILNQRKNVQLVNSFEFNSARKRMSVIVKDGINYKLYVKGADNIILARLDESIDQPFKKGILFKLDDLAKLGLRTLCMAVRDISAEEYEEISKKIADLADAANRDEKMGRI